MSEKDPNVPQRDLRGVDPPGTEKPRSGGFIKLFVLFILLVAIGLVAAYSAKIGRPPWEWTETDRQGFVEDSKQRVDEAKNKLESIDWDKVKTRVTDKTRELWNGAPAQDKKLEERQARARPAYRASNDGGRPTPAPTSYEQGLADMREGIAHYRRSPDDPKELAEAKKKFESAHGLLEKAVKEEQDEERRRDAAQTLDECNKYLEDCRTRERQ